MDGARLALSSNYLQVALPHSSGVARELADAHIARSSGGILYGYPESRS